MGLDMYLTAERYFWQHGENNDNNRGRQIAEIMADELKDLHPDKPEIERPRIQGVTAQIGYWRKANHIHKWFVDNVQDGIDECQNSYVDRDQLREIKAACETVVSASKLIDGVIQNGTTYDKDSPEGRAILEAGKVIEDPSTAKRLLPTESGFFFGSEDYNEWYLDDVKRTIAFVDQALSLPDDWSIYYRSSW